MPRQKMVIIAVLCAVLAVGVGDSYAQTAKLVGTYFEDPNKNGIQDRGEAGISGRTIITINLAYQDMTAETATDADGMYEFDLQTGRYLVQVVGTNTYNYIEMPDGYVTTQNLPNNPESPIPEAIHEIPSALKGTIDIGVLVPLTGELSSQGEEDIIAAELAIDDFNAYLAEKGRSWSISGIVEDSQTNPVAALEKVVSMHDRGVNIVVGPATSANLRNIAGYADANDMMIISFGSTAPSLAIPDDHIFRTVPDDNNQGPVIANIMAFKGIDVLVPVWRGDAWGNGIHEATTKSFVERGGIIDDGIRYNPEYPEFSTSASLLAEKIRTYVDQYGAEKVGVLIIAFGEVTQFMQHASSHDVLSEVMWFGTDGSTNVQSLADDPMGREFAKETDFTTVLFAASENPIMQRVADLIESELGRLSTVHAYSTYDAVWLAGLAMEAARNSYTKDVRAYMIPVSENHAGAVGPAKLNAAGDLESSTYAIWAIDNDRWEIVGSTSDLGMDETRPDDPPGGSVMDLVQQLFGYVAGLGDSLDELASVVASLDERFQSHSHDASGNATRQITWSMNPPVDTDDKLKHPHIIDGAVVEGFYEWERLNPELDFERVDYGADIYVMLEIETDLKYLGRALSTGPYAGTITIVLGNYDCNGRYNQYSQDTLQFILMHELGHLLELEHAAEPRHLMFSGEVHQGEYFDDLGYSIPESRPVTYEWHMGERSIMGDIAGADTMLNYLRGLIASSEDPALVESLIAEYDAIVSDHNRNADAVNCLHRYDTSKGIDGQGRVAKKAPFGGSD